MQTPIQHAVILSACPVTPAMRRYLAPDACVVACDAGYRNAKTLGVAPDWIIGDFDSAPRPPENDHTTVLPHVKDDTDTHYAARWLLAQGVRQVTLLGALGGPRLEHSLANIATGLFLAKQGVRVMLANERSELHYLLPGRPLTLARADWMYLSLFPLEGRLTGVELTGVYYPLQNAVLTADFPLGVSNEFTAPQARLACAGGCGLAVLTRADQPQ